MASPARRLAQAISERAAASLGSATTAGRARAASRVASRPTASPIGVLVIAVTAESPCASASAPP